MFVDAGQAEECGTAADDGKICCVGSAAVERWELCWVDGRGGGPRGGRGGMWMMDFPPHWMDAQPMRAYLLNFYVEPAARGQGLAYRLLKTAVEEARGRGVKVVSLHASKFGRPIYERNGFEQSTEMMLRLE